MTGRGKRGPGTHCLRMRKIAQNKLIRVEEMADTVVCRFCSKVEKTHCVTLFSPQRLMNDSNSVLEAVFEVKVSQSDERPRYACRKCDSSATRLHSQLCKLREMAKTSYAHQGIHSLNLVACICGFCPGMSMQTSPVVRRPPKRGKATRKWSRSFPYDTETECSAS
jgi:hypothetical protein